MGNVLGGNTFDSVVKEYLNEDEEMVKNIVRKKEKITFLFDIIDDDIPVTVKILKDNKYEYSYLKVKEQVMDPSFEDFLKLLMDDLYEIREKKIEYYNSLETPMDQSSGVIDFAKKKKEESDDEEEEEGEDYILTVTSPSMLSEDQFSSQLFEKELKKREEMLVPHYLILTPDRIIDTQAEIIRKVSEKIGVSKNGSNVILRTYRWNEFAIYRDVEKNGKDEVLKKCGLKITDIKKTEESGKDEKEPDPNEEFECPSCFDDLPYKNTMKLDQCQHRFCNDCWKDHITIRIKDGLAKRIMCMGGGCPCVIDENIVSAYITDESVKKKYDQKLVESFVEDNDRMKWCQSAPHCGNSVLINKCPDFFEPSLSQQTESSKNSQKKNEEETEGEDDEEAKKDDDDDEEVKKTSLIGSIPFEIHCRCKKSIFCFGCLEEAHNPCTCKMLQKWKRKCNDDSETLNWIKSNTRDCPQCGKATIKNGGCNHISCICGAHWCWACGGNFNTQTVYNHDCNRFLEQEGADQNTRQSLERYLHYFNHYNVHLTSFRNQVKMQMRTNQKVGKMLRDQRRLLLVSTSLDPEEDRKRREKMVKLEDLQFLKNALNVLFDTRRALMHSYIFAFFLFDRSSVISASSNPEEEGEKKWGKKLMRGIRAFQTEKERLRAKNLFEDTQEQLELTTESLNELLDLKLEDILQKKRGIEIKSVLCEKRIHILFEILRSYMMEKDTKYMLPQPRYIVTHQGEDRASLKEAGFVPSQGIPQGVRAARAGMAGAKGNVTHSPNGFLAKLKDMVERRRRAWIGEDEEESDDSDSESDW